MEDKFLNIHNNELQEILGFVGDEPIFFNDEMRLLTREEILNYKDEFNIEKDDIIPLIDLFDNDFLIYDIKEEIFSMMNIVDESMFSKMNTIEEYLELLKNYK